jgi:hypothetical protein
MEQSNPDNPPLAEPNEPDAPAATGPQESIPSWEKDLDVYPLRAPNEDPRWARIMVWTWVIFAVAALLFMIVLTTLGWWYD